MDSASPTMHPDNVLITTAIDAYEMRDVAIADVKGACSHAEIDEFLLIKMRNNQVETMCRIHDEYKKHATEENGERVPYVMLNSGLYGTL